MPAKIERPPQVTQGSRSAAVSRPKDAGAPAPLTTASPTPPTTTREVPVAAFTGQAAPARELVPQSRQVSTSADPSALWGAPPPASALTREAFAALSPAEQATQVAAVRAERDEVGKAIEARVEQLDRRWRSSRLKTRTGALRHYEGQGRHLGRAERRALRELVARSETAQRRIDELSARADALPKTPEAKREQAALRAELARELRKARAEQSEAVKAATELVDQEGLKVDRLAVTEPIIDPNAPAPGSGRSLLEQIAHFFHLDGLLGAFFDLMKVTLDTGRRQSQERQETQKADTDARRERQRVDERVFSELRAQEADAQARLSGLVSQLRPASPAPTRAG